MTRRTMPTLATMALLCFTIALPAGDAAAQQKSLKEQLVGAWTLVSSEITLSNGTKEQQYGTPNPKGILIFDAGGRYAQVAGRPDRPKFKSPETETIEELGAAAQDFAANFGTWSVSEADKTLTRRFEGALRPNGEGMDFKGSVSLAGDELKLTAVNPVAGFRIDAVYRRAR